MSRRPMLFAAVLTAGAMVAATACSTSAPTSTGTKLEVVATISAWGSVAAQLGGDRIHETSLITSPDIDPHSYEATPADARAVAGAAVVVANGIGYDSWIDKVLSADHRSDRQVVNVGKQVGAPDSGNPHQWYSPSSVTAAANAITDSYKRADPTNAGYFDQQRKNFLNQGLAKYRELIANIKSTYSGTSVGASESVFAPMSEALGLNLATPTSFLRAISQGADPSPADKVIIGQQIETKAITVFVYNRQNSTPDVQSLTDAARRQGIPVVSVTETLTPATSSFQDWQVSQLSALAGALHEATGR